MCPRRDAGLGTVRGACVGACACARIWCAFVRVGLVCVCLDSMVCARLASCPSHHQHTLANATGSPSACFDAPRSRTASPPQPSSQATSLLLLVALLPHPLPQPPPSPPNAGSSNELSSQKTGAHCCLTCVQRATGSALAGAAASTSADVPSLRPPPVKTVGKRLGDKGFNEWHNTGG